MTINRIRRGVVCLALFTITVFLGAAGLNAQSTTQGSIAGTVLDPTGAVVPGAAVTIQNTATNFVTHLTTDSSGNYRAPLLEPGTYTVSVAAQGFADYRAESVTVFVGQVTTLSPRLAVASSSASVVVTEQTPIMNTESPSFSSQLNMRALQSIPINNRRWSSLSMMTPGVVSDASGYGLVSIHGISPLMNNVEIDGADDNQAFFSEERGRTREAYSTAGAAVREFAVDTGVYSAQYGRAAGGVITSVTKSGTNHIHGQAYFWDRESNWAAYNNYSMVTRLVNGQNVSSHIKPEDLRKIYGFTAGGPLIKNKLFWIYTFDQHTHVFPVIGVPYNPLQFYTLPQATLTTGETCNTTTGELDNAPAGAINDANACALAARQHITYAQASYDWAALLDGSKNINASNYGAVQTINDLGLVSDIGQAPRFGYQEINMPKLDWQINPKEHWSVIYNRLRWDSPGGVQTANPDHYAQDAQGNDFVKVDYGITKLTSMITNSLSNELLYQFSRELDYETQQPYTPYTMSDLTGPGGNVPQIEAGYYNGFDAGSMYYAHRLAYPEEYKWQIGDVLYYMRGNHTIKFGIDTVHNNDLMNNTYKSNGDFSYDYVGNYFNDLLNMKNGVNPVTAGTGCNSYGSENYAGNKNHPVTGTYPCYYNFTQGFGNPVYQISTLDFGAFVQDNWKFSPRLTLELGLRWDKETLPGPDPNLTTATGNFVPYPGLTNNPSDNTAFGPRIGFAYEMFGSGKSMILRGGYGIYYGRITNGNLENVRLNTGSPHGQFTQVWYNDQSGAPVFPNIMSAGAPSSTPSSYFLSPDLKLPQVQEFDLEVQQALGKGTVLALTYLGALGRELPNFLDVNLDPATVKQVTLTVAGDPNGKGPLGSNSSKITVPVYTKYGNTRRFGTVAKNFQAITEMVSNVNSSYNGFVAEIQNNTLHSVQFDANYTWSHALDYGQAETTQGTTNAWYNPYGDPRVNYGNSNYNVPNRFVAYAVYHFPGLHTSAWTRYVVNGWSLDDSFQMQNGLPFTAGVNGKPSGAISGDLNGAGGTSVIPQIGTNTYRYPRHIVDDARLQKSFSMEGGRSLQLMLNAFNVANHQNVTGFEASYLYNLSGTTLTYTGVNGTGNKSFMVPNNSNSSGFLYTPRNIEISARLNF